MQKKTSSKVSLQSMQESKIDVISLKLSGFKLCFSRPRPAAALYLASTRPQPAFSFAGPLRVAPSTHGALPTNTTELAINHLRTFLQFHQSSTSTSFNHEPSHRVPHIHFPRPTTILRVQRHRAAPPPRPQSLDIQSPGEESPQSEISEGAGEG
jgi:hypothetical protein